MSFVAPLVFFLRPVSCFRGRPPLVYDVPLCSCCLAQSSRAFFQRWVSSGHFPGRLFFVFRCPALLIFCIVDPQGHIFVPAGAARPPTREQMGSPSRFPPPSGVAFQTIFLTFSYFSELCDFVKIELPCRRELGFEGPGRPKCHFFSLGAPSKILRVPGGSWHGGGGIRWKS